MKFFCIWGPIVILIMISLIFQANMANNQIAFLKKCHQVLSKYESAQSCTESTLWLDMDYLSKMNEEAGLTILKVLLALDATLFL